VAVIGFVGKNHAHSAVIRADHLAETCANRRANREANRKANGQVIERHPQGYTQRDPNAQSTA
jgi:hypothetical protein